jgi:CBS domain-containing protein
VRGRIQLARQTPVDVCQALLAIEPFLAGRNDDLLATMRRAAAQPATRLIGVLGDDGRVVGVLPILRLAEAVVARVVPESLLADISDIADVADFGQTVEARTVGDAMLPPATIRGDATVAQAFHVMHQRHLSGLYVVDVDGRPTGYLDLLELAVNYVDALEAAEDHPDQAARKAAIDPPDPPRDRR